MREAHQALIDYGPARIPDLLTQVSVVGVLQLQDIPGTFAVQCFEYP